MSKAIRWLLIVLAVIWVVHDPLGAAHLARAVMIWLGQAGQAFSTVTNNL